MSFVIGMDIGGVLFEREERKSKKWREHKLMPNCKDVLSYLINEKKCKLCIISRCGKAMEANIRYSLYLQGIDQWISSDNWYFVKKGSEKGNICLQQKVDYMIDDRKDILLAVNKHSPATTCLHFSNEKESPPLVVLKDWLHVKKFFSS